MSLSTQILAVRNASVHEVLRAVPGLGSVPSHEENGWVWFNLSPWDVDSETLLGAMHEFAGPVLLASLYQYEAWTLRLAGEGQLPFAICYEFSKILLDAEDDLFDLENSPFPPPPSEPLGTPLPAGDDFFQPARGEGGDKPSPVERLISTPHRLGLPVPQEVIDDLQDEKPELVTDAFADWVTDEILDALESFDIPHDVEEVEGVLLGDWVSDGELEMPEGNLPRFLICLGMTQGLVEWLDKVAEGDEGPLDELGEAQALREDLDHILRHSAKRTPQHIEDGPVDVSLRDLDLVVRVGWFCSHMVGAVIGFELPEGESLEGYPATLDWTPKGRGARTPIYPGDFLEYEEDRYDIATSLGTLPDHTRLTLWFGDDTYPVARQCYTGELTGGVWHISAASPPVSAETLRAALELAESIQRRAPLAVAGAEEFDQACKMSLETGNVEESLPRLNGNVVEGNSDALFEVAVALFRLRFAHQWDTAQVQQDEKQEAIGYFKELDEMFVRMEVPHLPELVHDGEGRKYYVPDIESMDFNDDREQALAALQRCEALALVAGYQPAGNLYCSSRPFDFMRLYLSPDRSAMLIESAGQMGMMARSLYTEFDDGTALFTTSAVNVPSVPHRGVLVRQVDDPALDKLGTEHEDGRYRLARAGRKPKVFDAALPELAKAIDRFFFRMEGKATEAPQIRSPRAGRVPQE
jgi:hypothetical protein